MDVETGALTPLREFGSSSRTHKTMPRISPDRRTVAFSDDIYAGRKYKGSELFLMAADGSDQTRLETLASDRTVWGYEDLKWLPGGESLVVSDRGEGVYFLGMNGKRHGLAPRPDSVPAFAISPDGKRIAYSGAGYFGVADLDTSLQRNYKPYPISGAFYSGESIVWVSDSKVLVSLVERNLRDGSKDRKEGMPLQSILWLINATTGKMDVVTRAEPDHYWWNLTLSPSGDRLAVDQSIQADFTLSNKVPSTSILTFDLSGENRKEIPIPPEYDVTGLSWSYR